MTREDIECIIKWFSHIEQLATDGKTANGFQMPPDKILATIKVVAKDSREYVEKFCNESVPNDLEEAAEAFAFKSLDEVILYGCTLSGRRACFIAGAKWQKEKDERIYRDFFDARNQGDASLLDLLAYQEGYRDGMAEQKEQPKIERKRKKNNFFSRIRRYISYSIWKTGDF